MATINPANTAAKPEGARKRIPMSVPTLRLEVPAIPGFHLHWFLESRVPRAIQGGYQMVHTDEVPVTQRGVGTSTDVSGNISLGTNVMQIGGTGQDGKPEHLVLMKIREEWWQEDKKALDDSNAKRLGGIFRGEDILGSERDLTEDRGTRYIDRSRTKALFNRPPRKQ